LLKKKSDVGLIQQKNKQTSNKQIQGRLDGDDTGLQLKVSYYNGLLQKNKMISISLCGSEF